MPTPLNPIDLSSAVVGTAGKIDLSNCGTTQSPAYTQQTATLQLYNESACGLRLTGKNTGLAFDLPSGGWNNVPIPVGETEIDYVVQYILPNPAVSSLLATYFAPNEPVPASASIGNSPVNVSNAVIQANEIVNTGSGILTPIINANELPGGGQRFIAAMNNDGSAQFGESLPTVAQVSWDNVGNLTAKGITSQASLKATAPVTLTSGFQETGYCGASFEVGGSVASAVGPTVNFKTVMTNAPTSITLGTPIENSGASSPGAADITIYGFWLTWTATAINSLSRYTNTYTTVGN